MYELIYEHIYHALELGGENLVCIGSDFDGAVMDKSLDSLEKVKCLKAYLFERGLGKPLLEKIFYDNASGFFQSVI